MGSFNLIENNFLKDFSQVWGNGVHGPNFCWISTSLVFVLVNTYSYNPQVVECYAINPMKCYIVHLWTSIIILERELQKWNFMLYEKFIHTLCCLGLCLWLILIVEILFINSYNVELCVRFRYLNFFPLAPNQMVLISRSWEGEDVFCYALNHDLILCEAFLLSCWPLYIFYHKFCKLITSIIASLLLQSLKLGFLRFSFFHSWFSKLLTTCHHTNC